MHPAVRPGERGTAPRRPQAHTGPGDSARPRGDARPASPVQPSSGDRREPVPEVNVLDIVFLAATVAFFLLSLAFVRGCDRL